MKLRKPKINSKLSIWNYFNDIKVMAVHKLNFNHEKRVLLKEEIDDLFRQATGMKNCPAWYIEPL